MSAATATAARGRAVGAARPRHGVAVAALLVAACGSEGPRIQARPQSVAFTSVPSPAAGELSVVVAASASSGLPVAFRSLTPARCSVGRSTGVVVASSAGVCGLEASQSGDDDYAPAPPATVDVRFVSAGAVVFTAVPALSAHDLGTIVAQSDDGSPVTYSTASLAVCSVGPESGLITTVAAGDCTIAAHRGADRAERTLVVSPPSAPSVPGAPRAVRATTGDAAGQVVVHVGALASGGLPLDRFLVDSVPAGLHAEAASSPIVLDCHGPCAGRAFTVVARNDLGAGPRSAVTPIVTSYDVLATFHEPDTQPNDTLFLGTFTLDATTGTVTGLRGRLSEAMTGGPTPYPDDTMTWVELEHQLSAVPVTAGGVAGLLVTTFRLPVTDTLSADPSLGGTDGWAPGSGSGRYFGAPGPNPGNAYATIFVDVADPTAAPTQAQVDLVAYADCAPGGMMGKTCMTGTSVAGHGTAGTMGGAPSSIVIWK
jgi:hypothetical protein